MIDQSWFHQQIYVLGPGKVKSGMELKSQMRSNESYLYKVPLQQEPPDQPHPQQLLNSEYAFPSSNLVFIV